MSIPRARIAAARAAQFPRRTGRIQDEPVVTGTCQD